MIEGLDKKVKMEITDESMNNNYKVNQIKDEKKINIKDKDEKINKENRENTL